MRKSINSLTLAVQKTFKMDPFERAVFIFCGRGRKQIKILEWDGDGFWLHIKRLEASHFKWPSDITGEKTMILTDKELSLLLGGPGLEIKIKRQKIGLAVM